MKRVLSGIQPSGDVHIGNYIGAIKRWVDQQDEHENFIMLADLHTITVPQKPEELRRRTIELTKLLLAAGIDVKKTTLFKQSDVPAHSELAWIMNSIAHMGELSRMVQFKDKSQKVGADAASVGLFDYPVLQAADILLYDADEVPVGEDQKQHIELTRDLAQRFNNRFGPTFKVPEPKIDEHRAKIMSLADPTRKMSKSDPENTYIGLLDAKDTIDQKIRKAVTTDEGLDNLVGIYSIFSGEDTKGLRQKFAGHNLDFKESLTKLLIEKLADIQGRYAKITSTEAKKILEEGSTKANQLATAKLAEVKNKVGLT